jgi:hypothetical protein
LTCVSGNPDGFSLSADKAERISPRALHCNKGGRERERKEEEEEVINSN